MAGYSGTPLPKKLGIRDGQQLLLLDAPSGFVDLLGQLPERVGVSTHLARGRQFDLVVFFATRLSDLRKQFGTVASQLTPSGGLWVAWPKKASGMGSDITEDRIRDVALPLGLVDNKVCAIDDTWSGLRCVIRRQNRPS